MKSKHNNYNTFKNALNYKNSFKYRSKTLLKGLNEFPFLVYITKH